MAIFYRIVRVMPNGNENILRDIAIADITQEQTVRSQVFADGTARTGQHIRLYSSDENGIVTREDCIWDSEINRPFNPAIDKA